MARQKQSYLPGAEPPSIKAIDKAAGKYVEARDERMALNVKETDAKDELIALMKEHRLEEYEFDDHVVTLSNKTNVKVRHKTESNGDGEEGEDE